VRGHTPILTPSSCHLLKIPQVSRQDYFPDNSLEQFILLNELDVVSRWTRSYCHRCFFLSVCVAVVRCFKTWEAFESFTEKVLCTLMLMSKKDVLSRNCVFFVFCKSENQFLSEVVLPAPVSPSAGIDVWTWSILKSTAQHAQLPVFKFLLYSVVNEFHLVPVLQDFCIRICSTMLESSRGSMESKCVGLQAAEGSLLVLLLRA
jgi:hypothetical protein